MTSLIPSPFGSIMPTRVWSDASRAYRYGFNGKEADKEGMGGGGSTYDYGFRIYNSNLCKFLSIDPYYSNFPMLSTYQYASNSPIWAIDLDGLEAVVYTYGSSNQSGDGGSDNHAFIAIYDETEGLIVYTYGRYTNDEDPYNSPGVLIKLTGQDALDEIEHCMKHQDAKATLIQKVDRTKVKEYYENKLNKGKQITKEQSEKYSNDTKTQKARIINKYNVLIGNMCSGEVLRGLKAGGFKWRKELKKPNSWTKKQKVKGLLAIQYSVQVLQARLDATIAEDTRLGEVRECTGVIDVTSEEKKKAGCTLDAMLKELKKAVKKANDNKKKNG